MDNSNPYALLNLIPNIKPVFDSKACRNLLNPTVRLVGYKFDGTPVDSEFIATSGFYNGYQNSIDHELSSELFARFASRTREIERGDILVMASMNRVRAIGIVLFWVDVPSIRPEEFVRLFKVAWTNSKATVELAMSGPFDKGSTISTGIALKELNKRIIENEDQEVKDSYNKLLTEIEKAQTKFLRSNLDLTLKAY